ncbi:DegV family protein [Lederbergia graminis]|uniref:DegV family protein n=1 Tax=Lederbergia graminis TaxID=735518 RepID=A0ABW0LBV8_9BACI
MRNIKIVTDSTCDLSPEEIKSLNIHVIPLSISIEGETYLDRVDITPSQFIEKMNQSTQLPKTSQPAVGEFLKLYDELGEDDSEILSIHLAGKLSGTVESARSAAEMSKTKVTVIDSEYIAKALSFQVKEAVKMVNEKLTISEIINKLKDVRANTKLYVVLDTLDNLVKGGRIGRGKAFIGSLLNIKPIAMLNEGEYTPVGKVRSQTQAINFIMKQLKNDVQNMRLKGIGISHANAYGLASEIKSKIEELIGFHDVEIAETTPVISTHTGSGAIGFCYYLE